MKSKTIAQKLALAFIVSAVLQSIVMWAILVAGGVIRHSKENAYAIFSEKVSGQADNLENQMTSVWTNFEHYTTQIRQYFTDEAMKGGDGAKSVDELLEGIAPVVLDSMYYTKTTGAFLILNQVEPGTNDHAALYFRNANPNRTDQKNASTYMLYGPWNVAERLHVVTDANWGYRLNLDVIPNDFYVKPFENIGLTEDTKLLGYWSKPFKPAANGEDVITYSVPLADKKGNPVGVFGVEISIHHLYKSLPVSQGPEFYGYIIGTQDGEDSPIRVSVLNGALQKSMLTEGQPLEMEAVSGVDSIYRLKGSAEEAKLYAGVNDMGMYYNNTPFSAEKWYLIGLIDRSALLRSPEKISAILGISFLVSLFMGTVLALVISRWFTKYSRLMELSEVPVGVFEMSGHTNRVLMTMQVPRLLRLSREQERRFTRDREAFCDYLRRMHRGDEREDATMRLADCDQEVWIRISRKERNGAIVGVIEDVTDEILQKRMLEEERDYDGMTGVKNRMAFEREIGACNQELGEGKNLCMVMCDLNGLKQVNDRFGHNVGDEYIRLAAASICKAFPGGQVYRIGGDEFAVLLENCRPQDVRAAVSALKGNMKRFDRNEEFKAGISAGFAFYDPLTDRSLGSVLDRADKAMYEDKFQRG
ncbi:MAG: GGDEF domain-containing protein [Enterocloster asparagiformis]|nr:GGDEF domain-containing protein [Enterocloster asparagiformis]